MQSCKMRVALHIAKKAGISRYHQLLKEEHAIQLKALMNEMLPDKEVLGLHPNIIGGRIFTIHDSCYTNHVGDVRIGLRKATDSLNFFIGEHVEEFFKKGYIDLLPFCLPIKLKTVDCDTSEEVLYMFAKNESDWTLVQENKEFWNNADVPVLVEAFNEQEIVEFRMEIYKKINFDKISVALNLLHSVGAIYKNSEECFVVAESQISFQNDIKKEINNRVKHFFQEIAETAGVNYLVVETDVDLEGQIQNFDFVIFTDVYKTYTLEKVKRLSESSYVTKIKIEKYPMGESNSWNLLEQEFIYLISNNRKWHKKIEDYSIEIRSETADMMLSAEIAGFNDVYAEQLKLLNSYRGGTYVCMNYTGILVGIS